MFQERNEYLEKSPMCNGNSHVLQLAFKFPTLIVTIIFFLAHDLKGETQRGCFNKDIAAMITKSSQLGCHSIPDDLGYGMICLCDTQLCNSSQRLQSLAASGQFLGHYYSHQLIVFSCFLLFHRLF